jgi:predicted nucleic acid-binding protein
MIGLDTTVLVAFEIREAPGHEQVRAHLMAASRAGTAQFALAPQVLQEFVHVVTDPRRFQRPLDLADALGRSRRWWEAVDVTRCHPGDRAWERAWTWMSEFRLGRKRILDTYLAATYLEFQVRMLATANPRDFAVFDVFEFEEWAILSG